MIPPKGKPEPNSESMVLVAIGSNRGLCSNFNRDLIHHLTRFISESAPVPKIMVIGERLRKMLERKHVSYSHYIPFPSASELNPSHVERIYKELIQPHTNGNLNLVFNRYRGAGNYRTLQSAIFPNDFIPFSSQPFAMKDFVLDTGAGDMATFLADHLHQLSFYFALLSSAASEHSTRFQLMENASTNADRLAEELFIEVQAQRRQKITSEMQELAVGAGLLEKRGKNRTVSGSGWS